MASLMKVNNIYIKYFDGRIWLWVDSVSNDEDNDDDNQGVPDAGYDNGADFNILPMMKIMIMIMMAPLIKLNSDNDYVNMMIFFMIMMT